jgi:alpha-beta hydrolase superfamily lysophospholipase
MGMTRNEVGSFEKKCIKALMPVLFRSVYGWHERTDAADAADYFDLRGVDGSLLMAVRFKTPHPQPKGTVLLCHPFLKYGMAYFVKNDYHIWLNQAGYDAVAFNFKGFGRSSISGIAFSDDVYSVARWAATQYPELPLHLLGTSFGGYHAIHSLARHEFQFDSLVFDSVPTQISSFFHAGPVGVVMRWLSRSRWGHPTGTSTIAESLTALNRTPCLFLYGSKDRYISEREIAQIGTRCRHAKVVIYQDCGHLEIRKSHTDQYVADITNFFDLHGVRRRTMQRLDMQRQEEA